MKKYSFLFFCLVTMALIVTLFIKANTPIVKSNSSFDNDIGDPSGKMVAKASCTSNRSPDRPTKVFQPKWAPTSRSKNVKEMDCLLKLSDPGAKKLSPDEREKLLKEFLKENSRRKSEPAHWIVGPDGRPMAIHKSK